jgi:hypothetical protein
MSGNEGNELIKLCAVMIILCLLITSVVAVFSQIDRFGRNAVGYAVTAAAPADLRHYAGRYNGSGIHTLVASGLPVYSGAAKISGMAQARSNFSTLRSYTVTWQEAGGSERLVVA